MSATVAVRTDWPLYARLSGFYVLYFATAGVFVPYWSLYLHDAGFSAPQIGGALAVLGMVRIVGPLAWGWLMDRSGSRMRLIGAGMAGASLCVALIAATQDYARLLLLHLAFGIFWNAAIPAYDVVVLGHVPRVGMDYPRMRLWGSVGFILSVAGVGPILDRTGMAPVPLLVIAGMLLMTGVCSRIPESPVPRRPEGQRVRFRQIARQPVLLALFASCFLVQVSFAPYFGFFSLFLSAHGYSSGVTGGLWAIAITCEVGVFLFAGRLIGRYGARAIFLLAVGSAALRWLGQAIWVDSLTVLAVIQVLHLSSGGLYHAVSVHYVHRLFPAHMQGKAQALLAGVSFGLGGSLGNYATGLLWDGDGRMVQFIAAGIAALAFAIAWRGVREESSGGLLQDQGDPRVDDAIQDGERDRAVAQHGVMEVAQVEARP